MPTMIMKGCVRIFLALAAYRNVFKDSDKLEAAGDTQVIIKVIPFPERLSAKSLVNLLSRYGI